MNIMTSSTNYSDVISKQVRSIRLLALLSSLLCTNPFLLGQESSTNAGSDEIIELSPFEVSTTGDGNYYVTDTLAGSRLRSDMKDIGAAITHVSKDFMDDLGASDIMEFADFVPSLEAINNQESGQDDNEGTYRPQSFRIRGLFTESLARNYHGLAAGTFLPQDGYNNDRITLSAGANSILFGSANPAGIINVSTLKAVPGRQFSKLLFRTDDYGTTRFEVHHNHSLMDDKAAIRIAYLNEDRNQFPEPSWKDQERIYAAGRLNITKNTKITGNFEVVDFHRNAPYYSNYRKMYGAWEDAGSQLVPYTGSNPTNGSLGIRNYGGQPFQTPIWGSVGQSDLLPSWRHHPISAFNNVTVANINREPTDPDFNNGRNLAGNLRVQDIGGWVGELNLEQKFTDNLYMQFSVFYHEIDQDMWISWSANQVNVDAASTLPDGSPNPDARRYFLDASVMQLRTLDFENLNFRWTSSYELDLRETSKWLGRHQIAAMIEDNSGVRYTNRGQLFNTDPARPNANNYLAGTNKLRPIIYVDPKRGVIGDGPRPDTRTMAKYLSTFDGVTAEWKNFVAGTHEEIEQRAYMIAAQSHFFNDRLVTTLGYRIDEQDFYNVPASDWDRDPETNFYLDYQDNKAKLVMVDEVSDISEGTYSLGAVFHLIENKGELDYLSLTYNQSNNFAPSPGYPTFDGGVTANSTGETEDMGIKVGMFKGKLNATLNYYESGQLNARGPNVANVVQGYNTVWDQLEEATGDLSYLDNKLDPQSANSDTFDNTSEGIEFQLVYTPVSNWRISVMASKNETIKTNILPATEKFMAEEFPKVKSAHGDFVMQDGQTVEEHLDEIVALLQPQFTQEGTRPLNQREWRYNLLTNYRFIDGPLKGFTIGGYLNWQDKPVIGYYRDENNQPNPRDIIYGDTLLDTGLNISYSTMIGKGKIEWVTQLNIRNLLDDTDIIPREAEQTSATDRTPYIYTYNFREPRTFILTTSFKF